MPQHRIRPQAEKDDALQADTCSCALPYEPAPSSSHRDVLLSCSWLGNSLKPVNLLKNTAAAQWEHPRQEQSSSQSWELGCAWQHMGRAFLTGQGAQPWPSLPFGHFPGSLLLPGTACAPWVCWEQPTRAHPRVPGSRCSLPRALGTTSCSCLLGTFPAGHDAPASSACGASPSLAAATNTYCCHETEVFTLFAVNVAQGNSSQPSCGGELD